MQPHLTTTEDWARFLRPLLAAVPNAPSPEDFRARLAAIAFALSDVPRHMLTEWRQREAVRRFRYWPTPAELAEWLGPDLKDERETTHRRLAAPEQTQARREPTDAEIQAVRAKARATAAALRDQEPPEMRKVREAPVSPAALLATYEQLASRGNAAAATRAEMLRKEMAG